MQSQHEASSAVVFSQIRVYPRKSAADSFLRLAVLASFAACHIQTHSGNQDRAFDNVLHVGLDVLQ